MPVIYGNHDWPKQAFASSCWKFKKTKPQPTAPEHKILTSPGLVTVELVATWSQDLPSFQPTSYFW